MPREAQLPPGYPDGHEINDKGGKMQQIESSKKYQNGIQVFWPSPENDGKDFFTFDELIEQRINALDLLNNPEIYLIDPDLHTIKSSA
ncbi:MAG: hypothetical protein WCC86_08840 [Methanoregula sp.]|uniref:hypothetical protein n=1 Tax=Methanoregula sp. TaxID=2052170 RepID=UPI003BB21ABF